MSTNEVMGISEPAECGFERKRSELKHFDGFGVFCRTEGFSENIRGLFRSRNVLKINETSHMNFSNIVITSINVFRARVINVVFGMVECCFRIGVDRSWSIDSFSGYRGV